LNLIISNKVVDSALDWTNFNTMNQYSTLYIIPLNTHIMAAFSILSVFGLYKLTTFCFIFTFVTT